MIYIRQKYHFMHNIIVRFHINLISNENVSFHKIIHTYTSYKLT